MATGVFLRLLAQEPDDGRASEKNSTRTRYHPTPHDFILFFTTGIVVFDGYPVSFDI